MFTGIIEAVAEVSAIRPEGTNLRFRFCGPISRELKIDQSVSHNGVCLTVVASDENFYEVVAIRETLEKSNLGGLKTGDKVNLERCMVANGRFDGHIVQGHVDQTGVVKSIVDENGSWRYEIAYDAALGNVTVEKGSIAVNGVSLTCFGSGKGHFTVAIIPYTYEHTNFHRLRPGDVVNLEFDIIGKYVQRLLDAKVR
ncbi:MAG TPA: riboflavin synthase [Ohtaekwangia sp.]|nr:riboflavin synthase [Ohtaekwangia sp.]